MFSKMSRKKQYYYQTFRDTYSAEFPCILNSDKGERFGFCKICRCDINISHGGKSDISVHIKSAKHLSNVKCQEDNHKLSRFFVKSGGADLDITRSECLFTSFLIEHNIPLAAADHAGALVKKMFPDLEIAKKYGCGRTKTSAIMKEMASDAKSGVVQYLKSWLFSVATDGSNDTSFLAKFLSEAKIDSPAKVDIEATAEPDHHYLVLRSRARRISTATTICLFLTALLVMSIGIIGGMYLYRQFAQVEMHRFRGWCSIPYDGTKASMYHSLQQDSGLADSKMFKSIAKSDNGLTDDSEPQFFDEKFELDLENENFEKIDVPDFRDGRRGRFIHDFNANKTGIIDLDESRCFVMPLDRNRVLAPRSLFDLIKKMWEGYYEVNTEVVRETMRVVTPAITDFKTVGYYIARECEEKPTYMLEKYVSGVFKRSVPGKSTEYAGFAGNNIYQLHILGIPDDDAAEVKKIEEA